MGSPGYVYSITYSSDGKALLASSEYSKPYAGYVGKLRVWDAADGKILRDIDVAGRAVASALSPDGRRVAVAEYDAERDLGIGPEKGESKSACLIEVFDVRTGERLAGLKGENRMTHALAFSRDGKLLTSIGSEDVIRTWDIDREREVRSLKAEGHFRANPPGSDRPARIQKAAISPDATLAVTSGMWDDRLIVRDLKTGRILHTIRVPKNGGAHLAFAPNGRIFASSSSTHGDPEGDDTLIRLWDTADGRELLKLDTVGHHVASIGFSPDGKSLVTGMNDTTTLVWDVSAAYATKPAKAD
jgi:WD40 repeat protein